MNVDNPNLVIIGRCNKAFYLGAVMAELQGVAFEDALYRGQHQPTAYSFMHAGYPCRMLVDAVALREQTEEAFPASLKKAVSDAIDHIPEGMCGDLNDQVRVDCGPYHFDFCITGYWCTKSPDDNLVEDPTMLPIGAQLGREVELRIGFAT